jgi:hypothetical protein
MTDFGWYDQPSRLGGRGEQRSAVGGGAAGATRGFIEILVYATDDRRLVLSLDGSGVPRLDLAFHSGAELGDFLATLLEVGDAVGHPILTALREAAGRLPPAD